MPQCKSLACDNHVDNNEQSFCDTCKADSPYVGDNALDFLSKGKDILSERAEEYSVPTGERNMAKTVTMFNTLTGHNLSVVEGWKFMAMLKMVRSQKVDGSFHEDSYVDLINYTALAAEAHKQEVS